MTDHAPWLRPWREVREVFLLHARLRERREREAEAMGIQCKPRRERKEKVPCS